MAVPGYVLKHRRTTLERVEKFISGQYFTDCNLFGRLYPKRVSVSNVTHFAAPECITYQQAVQEAAFTKTCVGEWFGPTWSTHWFKLELEIPAEWIGEEVRLIWDLMTEAMVWKDGEPMQGLSPDNRRTDFIISKNLTETERRQVIYIEMVVQGGVAQGDLIAPLKPDSFAQMRTADLAVMDRDVQTLIFDLEVLIGLVTHLPENSNRSYQALYTANEIVNAVVIDDRTTYHRAHKIAEQFFAQRNGEAQHRIMAVGNCHIDTAWLWQFSETKRKCARSFSSTVRLLEQYPQFTFVCSQAQQFEWMKENYPTLYQQMKQLIADGRFIPVGGTWVEMDGNIPSGEAFVRQFLLGQRYFLKEFGLQCTEFWLPDTFGYSAQLPQIISGCGISRFVTQKLSWSLVNQFPHNSFWWKGIDGSRVLTHFPPGNSYTMHGTVEELVHSLDNFKDKGRSNHSLFLYGYGDGGQGPTEEMIERLTRMEDIDGLPKVEFTTPDKFFTALEAESSELCCWAGELYLELHNGTYTTQAQTKKSNRKCEFVLRDVEIMSSLAHILSPEEARFHYPSAELTRLWKTVLLNQFHDVLPGTSINAVYKETEQSYADVLRASSVLLSDSSARLMDDQGFGAGQPAFMILNTMSWPRHEVVTLPEEHVESCITQTGSRLALVIAEPFGYTLLLKSPVKPDSSPCVETLGDGQLRMKNRLLEAVIDKAGRISLLRVAGSKRNLIAADHCGNQFVIFDDVPLYWDAWDVMDYHLETRKLVSDISKAATAVESGPLRATVEVELKISDTSSIKQTIVLDAECPYLKFVTQVDWHESHKFLKVEFPVSVVSKTATYEIQFGHLQRPTHFNTSWDWARFEVCGHKWADVSEYDLGLALINDCKYGWSCIDNVLRLSLLRSSKSPDDVADMGSHCFTYAAMPHTGTFQAAGVIQAAYNLNSELRVLPISAPANCPRDHCSFLTVSSPAVIVEALKQAEDVSNAFVLRLYEAFGSHVTADITINLPVKQVHLCNLLESPIKSPDPISLLNGVFQLDFAPFQIISVLLFLS